MKKNATCKNLLSYACGILLVMLCLPAFACEDELLPKQNPDNKAALDSFNRIPFKKRWIEQSPVPNPKRLAIFGGIGGGIYAGAMVGLDQIWYKQYPRSKFHFFNDIGEWNQIDKCGHIVSSNFVTTYAYHALRWGGMKKVPAALTAGGIGFGVISSIEIFDGFSSKWGASASDLGANFLGAALATVQYATWGEQRILLKYSFHIAPLPKDKELRERYIDLYGGSPLERLIKDYNNITTWVSFNTSSFFPSQKKAKWLNIAFGYGAGNMYGGFNNTWTDKAGVYHDRRDVERTRRFFISLDADFTKFKVRSKVGRTILGLLNIIKLPMPALEFNTAGQVVFHPMYFLNFSMPVYFKK